MYDVGNSDTTGFIMYLIDIIPFSVIGIPQPERFFAPVQFKKYFGSPGVLHTIVQQFADDPVKMKINLFWEPEVIYV